MLELDKKLNLILNLTEGPDSKSTSQAVNEQIGKMHSTLEKMVQLGKKNNELLKEEEATRQRISRLSFQHQQAQASGNLRQMSSISSALDSARSNLYDVRSQRADVKSQKSSAQQQLQEQRNAYEKLKALDDRETARREKEEERRARSAIRAMKKQEKERDKFVRSAKGALDGLLSLAESAALAYASMMNIDDNNVKKWLQWFAAIKSVGQGISGVYQLYKSINQAVQFLTSLRKADTIATAANTVAVSLNTKAEAANCAARRACEGAGGGEGGGSLLDKAKGWGKAAWGYAKKGGGWAATAARGAWGAATSATGSLIGAVGWGIAAGEVFNYARTGETLTGAIGSTWSARTAAQKGTRDNEIRASRLEIQRREIARERNSPQFRLQEAMLGVDARTSQNEALGGIYGTSSSLRGLRRSARSTEAQIFDTNAAAQMAKDYAESPNTRAVEADQARKKAVELEIQSINKVLELKKQQQEIEMRTAQDALKGARAVLDISKNFEDGFKAIADAEKAAREAEASGVLGAKRGDVKRGLDILDKIKANPDAPITYRESQVLQRSGLNLTESEREYVAYAQEQRAGQIDPRLAARMKRSYNTEDAARREQGLEGANAITAKANVEVKQDVLVKLQLEQEKSYDALIEQVAPKLAELVKKRDEIIAAALVSAMEAQIMERVKEMTDEAVQQLKEQMDSEGR